MLIISRKKDYYDGVVGTMGIDKTLVYNREPVEIEEKDYPKFLKKARYSWRGTKDTPFISLAYHDIKSEFKKRYGYYGHFVIGFCGKSYVGWKLYHEEYDPNIIAGKKLITEITYDFELIKKIIKARGYWGNIADDVENIKNLDSLQYFREFKAPVFVYDADFGRTVIGGRYLHRNVEKFIINPLLKDYEFYKVFDAFQAFQEISMFMGGVLGRGEKEIVEVADKYKITQHGFDKWSFRKEPQKK